MSNVRRATKFICMDCVFGFQLLTPEGIGRNERKYCPKCGDHFGVQVLKEMDDKDMDRTGKFWSKEEIEYLDKYIRGEVEVYHLAIKLRRSIASIKTKRTRRKEELGIEKQPAPGEWGDQEKALVDRWLDGEIKSVKELADRLGRPYQSVKSYGYRRRNKRKSEAI